MLTIYFFSTGQHDSLLFILARIQTASFRIPNALVYLTFEQAPHNRNSVKEVWLHQTVTCRP